mmetsp:Transcript_36835/g.67953  ORF Transcript_36835/g.67953 Transcript_36835/m.67953 type:complete len:375 (+) Transcript_36835:60-1184(+)
MSGPGQTTVDVDERLRFDERSLERFLDGALPGFQGSITVKKFGYGASNPTYFVSTSSGQKYVLRKKPPGKLIKGAHAVEREFRVMKALCNAGYEAPPMHLLCEDDSVIGTPFYIMGFVKGQIVDNGLHKLPVKHRRSAMFAIVESLAKLHRYDAKALGLMEAGNAFGQDGGFYERQIKTMSRTSEMQVSGSDGKVAAFESMPALLKLFAANMPQDRSCVVHGDWKPDNVILSDGEGPPSVLAVVDWELSTIGHPLSDLANMCLPYYLGPMGTALKYPPFDLTEGGGNASEEEVHQAYCKAAGLPFPIADWTFFIAFSIFRLAVIVQGVAMRWSKGQGSLEGGSSQAAAASQGACLLCDKAYEMMSAAYGESSKL